MSQAEIAQPVEHFTRNEGVVSSNLIFGLFFRNPQDVRFCGFSGIMRNMTEIRTLCRKKICCKGRLLLQVSGKSVRTAYPDGAFGRTLQRAHQLLPFSCAATRASRSRREKTQPQ